MSLGTKSNPSVVSFVKYIRPDLDLEEIEFFVNDRQGQGDVYEEALNIGKWQTVERQSRRETDVNDMQNQKGKGEHTNMGNHNRFGATSRNRRHRRTGSRKKIRTYRKDGSISRASYRNNQHTRVSLSDGKSKGSGQLELRLQPINVSRTNSAASAPTSSLVVKTWGGSKTFADCLRSTPSNVNPQPSIQEALSLNMNIDESPLEPFGEATATPRSSPTGEGTEEPTPELTATTVSTSRTAPPAISSISQASEPNMEERENDSLPPNPLLYDAVSEFSSYSEHTTPKSSSVEYEIADHNLERYSSVHTKNIAHEMPQFPYTVQSPHKDHRILDPAQILREFGASHLLDHPERTEFPSRISVVPSGKKHGSKNKRLKQPVKQTPAEFKIGLPQNFKPTPQQLEDLRNSFLSVASESKSSGRAVRNIVQNRAGNNQVHNQHLDVFENRRLDDVTTPTNQQLFYHSWQQKQSYVIGRHTQETTIRPIVHLQGSHHGDSLRLQNSLSALAHIHLEEKNKKPLQHTQQYTSISTPYRMSMNNTPVPDLNSRNLSNTASWQGTADWAYRCGQQPYQLSQSLNHGSMGCALESESYGEHNLSPTDSIIPPLAYPRRLWGARPGEAQLSYVPRSKSNNRSTFWGKKAPPCQIKEYALSQDGYSFYNSVN